MMMNHNTEAGKMTISSNQLYNPSHRLSREIPFLPNSIKQIWNVTPSNAMANPRILPTLLSIFFLMLRPGVQVIRW